ncbi:MAG: hypothetical protein DWQ08_12690 [Proteobacteria bacterium]|nr:MAG: hypothetical protein DWQ08_12690 [Pseudomonadota bacterium]
MFRNGRFFSSASILCVLLFLINLVLGKIEVANKIDTKVHLEGAPEFLLLLASVILFVISTLLKERAEIAKSAKSQEA